MRAVLFGVLVLLLPACENDKIAACGYACTTQTRRWQAGVLRRAAGALSRARETAADESR